MDRSPKFSRLTKIWVKEVDSDVIFKTRCRNMASCAWAMKQMCIITFIV